MNRSLPVAAGIGLRAPHVARVLAERPAVAWFEVHSENYFADGGAALEALLAIRRDYPVSLHGVGLSLGSPGPLDRGHLAKLRRLVDLVEPAAVSEHLCWSRLGRRHFNELLPLPYTVQALRCLARHIGEAQDALGRELLVENVSSYHAFEESTAAEGEFVAAVADRAGCRLLVDVNNVHVNAANHGLDPLAFLDAIPASRVAEIHLAGHDASGPVLVDTHGAPVAPAVWSLYEAALARFGPVPTLIEWDNDIPALEVLAGEAATAQRTLERFRHDALAA